MVKSDGVIVIGGSIAGYNVVKQLRKEGYQDKITMIEAKNTLPYDRSKLSKEWMQDSEKIKPPLFQGKDYFKEKKIKVMLNTKVVKVHPKDKKIETDSNKEIPYDRLVIASGSSLNKLQNTDEEALGVFYLRDHENALEIKEWAKNVKNLAIIGGGFIGLELAASFSELGIAVTVVERDEYPLANILGKEASKYFMEMHENHGVKFITGESAKVFEKDHAGKLKKVITTKNTEIPAEMAIIGIGVSPNQSVEVPNLAMDRGILVNKYGETNLKDIYAAGDITVWPYKDENIHVEHWENAFNQGKNLARNIVEEKSQPYNTRPYFWTDQYDQTFERLGHAKSWDRIIKRGSLEDKKFTLAYVDEANYPLAIFFANNGDKRKEVAKFMDKNQAINIEKFQKMEEPLNQ